MLVAYQNGSVVYILCVTAFFILIQFMPFKVFYIPINI